MVHFVWFILFVFSLFFKDESIKTLIWIMWNPFHWLGSTFLGFKSRCVFYKHFFKIFFFVMWWASLFAFLTWLPVLELHVLRSKIIDDIMSRWYYTIPPPRPTLPDALLRHIIHGRKFFQQLIQNTKWMISSQFKKYKLIVPFKKKRVSN